MSSSTAADDLRKRLVKIDDEVRTLAPGDFAERYRLRSQADVLRRKLEDLVTEDPAPN